MLNIKQSVIFIILMLSISSCQYNEYVQLGMEVKAITMSFYAGIEIPTDSSMTKTTLDGTPSDAFRNVLWESQDKVYVTNGASCAQFVNQTEGTSDIAVLEGSIAQGANYFAAYPYDMVTGYSSTGFTIEIPSVQSYCKDGVASGSFPMVAQCEEGIFNFKNLCGIFVVQLIGEQSISSIEFSGKDADDKEIPVAGHGTVSMYYSDVPYLDMNSSSETKVTLNCKESVKLNKSVPVLFHIVLPAVTYDTFDLVITSDDGSEMIIHSDKELAIKRSMRTTSTPLTYSPTFNLNSDGETSNCYIVSEAGMYKFKSVQGSSSASVGTVSSVEVLWESFGTDVTPKERDLIKEVSFGDNNIYFTTSDTFKEGNAVIAAKNSSGEILWSWHIWLTDKPKVVGFGIYDDMMDRNLGATSATPGDVGALGLLYQWGRKDPFLGSSSISESIVAKSTGSWPVAISSSSTTGTIEFATEHPMTFIVSYNDWYYNGSEPTNNSRWGDGKTTYDPCPVGWLVPAADWSSVSNEWRIFDHPYDDTNKGMNFYGKFGYDNRGGYWYPASGYRGHSNGELFGVGQYGRYWSKSPWVTTDKYNKSVEILEFSYTGYVNQWADCHFRACGFSVRCIKR